MSNHFTPDPINREEPAMTSPRDLADELLTLHSWASMRRSSATASSASMRYMRTAARMGRAAAGQVLLLDARAHHARPSPEMTTGGKLKGGSATAGGPHPLAPCPALG